MKKTVVLLFMILSLFSYDNGRVIKVEKDIVSITQIKDIKEGMSVFVSRKLDNENEVLIAKCEVLKDRMRLKCKPFDMLEQSSLSIARAKVKIDDVVYVSPLKNSAIIVAPTFEAYANIKKHLRWFNFIPIDMLGIRLLDEDNPEPEKEDFVNFCNQNFIGTVLFGLNDGVYEVDCLSFKKIKRYNIKSNTKKFQRPFFTRVGEIEKSWYDFSSNKLKDFSAYYKGLFND